MNDPSAPVRVLIVSPVQVHPTQSGGNLRSFGLANALARRGAEVFVYSGCEGGHLVADVIRLDKGHTEGLEPNVTEQIVRLMLAVGAVRGTK